MEALAHEDSVFFLGGEEGYPKVSTDKVHQINAPLPENGSTLMEHR